MQPDPDRIVAAVSALFGGAFWGLFHLATTLMSGQPVGRADTIRAVANIVIGILGGGLVAYFVAPAIAPLIPLKTLRDLHALGFGIGASAWEVAPFAYRLLHRRAASFGQGKRP